MGEVCCLHVCVCVAPAYSTERTELFATDEHRTSTLDLTSDSTGGITGQTAWAKCAVYTCVCVCVAPAYSTERTELFATDEHRTATLDLTIDSTGGITGQTAWAKCAVYTCVRVCVRSACVQHGAYGAVCYGRTSYGDSGPHY